MSTSWNSHRWIATPAPLAGRWDDISFLNSEVGLAVNANGEIYKTLNGGKDWCLQCTQKGIYFRSVSMVSDKVGWAGTTTPGKELFRTIDGENWTLVETLPREYHGPANSEAPTSICGLWALPDEKHVFASGTNNPERPARFLKTTDGGMTWWARDMEGVAALLVDIYFTDELNGWVVGGRATVTNPRRDDVVPTVLRTRDGGRTWKDVLGGLAAPRGEWGWKIQRVEDRALVVSCENLRAGSILLSEDDGETWRRREIVNAKGKSINENLEGIGFLDKKTGWVGGWGDRAFDSGRTSHTVDGGETWTDVTQTWARPLDDYECAPANNPYGQYMNRFRVVGGVAYASGNTIYKFTDETIEREPAVRSGLMFLSSPESLEFTDNGVDIALDIPEGARSLSVQIYDRFAGLVRTLLDEKPAAGHRILRWDLRGDNGELLAQQQFTIRVSIDERSESRLAFRKRPPVNLSSFVPHVLRES